MPTHTQERVNKPTGRAVISVDVAFDELTRRERHPEVGSGVFGMASLIQAVRRVQNAHPDALIDPDVGRTLTGTIRCGKCGRRPTPAVDSEGVAVYRCSLTQRHPPFEAARVETDVWRAHEDHVGAAEPTVTAPGNRFFELRRLWRDAVVDPAKDDAQHYRVALMPRPSVGGPR